MLLVRATTVVAGDDDRDAFSSRPSTSSLPRPPRFRSQRFPPTHPHLVYVVVNNNRSLVSASCICVCLCVVTIFAFITSRGNASYHMFVVRKFTTAGCDPLCVGFPAVKHTK